MSFRVLFNFALVAAIPGAGKGEETLEMASFKLFAVLLRKVQASTVSCEGRTAVKDLQRQLAVNATVRRTQAGSLCIIPLVVLFCWTSFIVKAQAQQVVALQRTIFTLSNLIVA